MKLGTFSVGALCLFASVAHATPSPSEQAVARSRARDHAGAIELYRQAYELDSDPALLVRIAHEHLLAGDATLLTGGLLYVTGRADRKRAERA